MQWGGAYSRSVIWPFNDSRRGGRGRVNLRLAPQPVAAAAGGPGAPGMTPKSMMGQAGAKAVGDALVSWGAGSPGQPGMPQSPQSVMVAGAVGDGAVSWNQNPVGGPGQPGQSMKDAGAAGGPGQPGQSMKAPEGGPGKSGGTMMAAAGGPGGSRAY